ncbi:aminodeoxychorismate lyase [Pseudohongiella spirulinae]|uniref:Aminodeoxychorismate lyase n=1 Tax=Pseudohongiella spirulinae TaxID=1249552 RepID=A0A0S2KCX7_9GAMM|nr:aminodeoxychorismate lyase [Pseudohongiella spirulinae]ALO46168.1 Aminotransferase, class IV superfamily [Pseudohongiella spirulinae]
MTALVFIDGQASHLLPASDRSIQYGDGLFETMSWSAGQLKRLDKHMSRLRDGCAVLGIAFEQAKIQQQLESFLGILAGSTADQQLVVKLIISRGSGGRGYTPPDNPASRIIISSHPVPDRLPEYQQTGIDCILCNHRLSSNPTLCGIKHLNRLDQVLGSAEVQRVSGKINGMSEGLMLDQQGRVIEGTRSNLFLIRNDELMTPNLVNAGVKGIMRQCVLEVANDSNWPVRVTDIYPRDLTTADSAFICNSIIGIIPLRQLWLSNECSEDSPPVRLGQHNYIRELQSLLA